MDTTPHTMSHLIARLGSPETLCGRRVDILDGDGLGEKCPVCQTLRQRHRDAHMDTTPHKYDDLIRYTLPDARVIRVAYDLCSASMIWPKDTRVIRVAYDLCRAASTIAYTLPDGRIVRVTYDVCRAASTIAYTLADSRIVEAVIVRGER